LVAPYAPNTTVHHLIISHFFVAQGLNNLPQSQTFGSLPAQPQPQQRNLGQRPQGQLQQRNPGQPQLQQLNLGQQPQLARSGFPVPGQPQLARSGFPGPAQPSLNNFGR
jgi:hypothetical protein